MGPGYFILAIMGCGDGAVMCEDIRETQPVYRSEAACLADSDAALDSATDAPYPLLVAECRRISPQMAEARSARAG
ncbi:MAG: hypothetical protein LC634_04180 [Sphingomonadales bacterium]|nr:hypothetical protein [Sphingomonadales bacterium]